MQGKCAFCHGPNSVAGAPPNGLELDNYDNVMRGSNFFPVVQVGNPEASTLILLLRSGGMPASASPDTPSVPLPEEQINLIARWIEQGAENN
ncbi:MAG: c-type cytochrome domain-containing protein [Anaerolineae bacterium]|nr:c-type cytochrome domain-containing protein [Anaerolineae bacterium]MDQ7036894.1 c-type cytochrome domain-containing protein [Anaerolineae bacterium]